MVDAELVCSSVKNRFPAADQLTPDHFKTHYLDAIDRHYPQPPKRFRSIRALRVFCGAAGTHSVIDILRVAPQPGILTASPLTDHEMQRVFGGMMPSSAAIEMRMDAIADLRPGGAAYLFAYCDKQPTRTYFVGATGD